MTYIKAIEFKMRDPLKKEDCTWPVIRMKIQFNLDARFCCRGALNWTSGCTKIESELDAEHSKDAGELANEVEDNEVLEGMGQAGLLEIVKIDAALERIERGDYGVCASCGGDISAERLDVLPYTPMCKTCAANAKIH